MDLNIVRPLLDISLDEVSATLGEKFGRTDLHTFLIQSHPDLDHARDNLRAMLSLPVIKAQINQRDGVGWTPLTSAMRALPEAVELLLRAGASPRSGACLLHHDGPASPDQWKTVSALIRAGYPTDERSLGNFGRSPLHYVAAHPQPNYRYAVELVRHGGHLLNWNAREDDGDTPLEVADYWAHEDPDNKQLRSIHELYKMRQVPPHAQYISSFDGERLMDEAEAAKHSRISLIDTALAGDAELLGQLISAGAMVNERDEYGQTLLHLAAMGNRVPNAYRVALELVRHGGRIGVDWDAVTAEGMTARQLARQACKRKDLDDCVRKALEGIRELLRKRRLPPGESYIFPCMDSNFCRRCGSLPCVCPKNDVRGMPGALY